MEELLERYFEGETSAGEEQRIRAFFASGDVPEHLAAYKPLFAYFDEEIEQLKEEEAAPVPVLHVGSHKSEAGVKRAILYTLSGVAACGFRLVGHDGGAVRDEAVPVYVTRFGDSAKRQILENGGLVPLFSAIKKFVLLEG